MISEKTWELVKHFILDFAVQKSFYVEDIEDKIGA
jgi:hypothetical protein